MTNIRGKNMVNQNNNGNQKMHYFRTVTKLAEELGINRTQLYEVADRVCVDITKVHFTDEELDALRTKTPLRKYRPIIDQQKIEIENLRKINQEIKETFEKALNDNIKSLSNDISEKESQIKDCESEIKTLKNKILRLERKN